MIVETVVGGNIFSNDTERHLFEETHIEILPNANPTKLLTDKATSLALVDSFFTNTHGLVEFFDEQVFLSAVRKCYSDPSSMQRDWLCQFNLVLAIGLCLGTPRSAGPQWELIERLRSKLSIRPDRFYSTAINLVDPFKNFEEGGLWSIQTFTLLSLYMLLRSKRNTAYLYVGMAIRLGYAHGIHRSETLGLFAKPEQQARRQVWQSLIVLDRFLAVSLGRPVAIAEEDSAAEGNVANQPFNPQHKPRSFCGIAFEATIRSCRVLGAVLRRVYHQRMVSVKETQSLAELCKEWPQNLSPHLESSQASSNDLRQAIAILHCNLIYWHSVVLLTRPFFLYLLSTQVQRERLNINVIRPRREADMTKFSDACLTAAIHTVAIVHHAYEAGYLPRISPVPVYCLFAAALIISANEFQRPLANTLNVQRLRISTEVLQYCGQEDPQAHRAAIVLNGFRQVLQTQDVTNPFGMPMTPDLSSVNTSTPRDNSFIGGTYENPSTVPLVSDLGPHGSASFPGRPTGSTAPFAIASGGQPPIIDPGQSMGQFPFAQIDDFERFTYEDFDFESLWQTPDGNSLPQ